MHGNEYGVVVQYVDTVDVMPIGFDNVEDAVRLRDEYVRVFTETNYSNPTQAQCVYVIYGGRINV